MFIYIYIYDRIILSIYVIYFRLMIIDLVIFIHWIRGVKFFGARAAPSWVGWSRPLRGTTGSLGIHPRIPNRAGKSTR